MGEEDIKKYTEKGLWRWEPGVRSRQCGRLEMTLERVSQDLGSAPSWFTGLVV